MVTLKTDIYPSWLLFLGILGLPMYAPAQSETLLTYERKTTHIPEKGIEAIDLSPAADHLAVALDNEIFVYTYPSLDLVAQWRTNTHIVKVKPENDFVLWRLNP